MAEKLLLIDGPAVVYRSFYAFTKSPLKNSKGENTGALFGYTNTLLSLLDELKPKYGAVAFDTPEPTFRHKLFEDYKATRIKMPDELVSQLSLIKAITEHLGIKLVELPGYEADDIIATFAKEASNNGIQTIIFSADKDIMQVVRENIVILNLKSHYKDWEYLDRDGVTKKMGVPPEKIPDMLSLIGDTSDNIPGVPGIGPKTAVKILEKYGSISKILENPECIQEENIRDKIIENIEKLKFTRKLTYLDENVPVELKLDELKMKKANVEELGEIFQNLEFFGLMKRFASSEKEDIVKGKIEEISDIVSVIPGEGGNFYAASMGKIFTIEDFETLTRKSPEVYIFEDAKKMMHLVNYEIDKFFDISLADYVLHPEQRDHSVERLSMRYLGEIISNNDFRRKALAGLKLYGTMKDEIKNDELEYIYYKIEKPLVNVLYNMEKYGILIDIPYLERFSSEIGEEINGIETDIFEISGHPFNLRSPKQIGKVFFEELKLPVIKRTKTGYSTNIEVLEKLARDYEIAQYLIKYRELYKLKSTYIDAIPQLVDSTTNRVHTTFSQTTTATGRLSSISPNLQNIPIRGEIGKNVRKCFIAPPENVILSADYSQIELRILAHISGDKALIEAFRDNRDIHTETAAKIFGIFGSEVSGEMRRKAKVVNFGIVYGMSSYGLAKELEIDVKDAALFIEHYFKVYPGVKEWVGKVKNGAYETSEVRTLFGRRRRVQELKAKNKDLREYGERIAINTPIQGTAADIIKMAMVNIYNTIKREKYNAHLILQIHDELVFEVPKPEVEGFGKMIKSEMENVVKLDIPLKVDIGIGKDWLEAHS